MPFFNNASREAVKTYCEARPLAELQQLNRRIGTFIIAQLDKKERIEQEIGVLSAEMTRLEESLSQISFYNTDIEAENERIRDSLPGNSTERYLALQYLREAKSSVEQTIEFEQLTKKRTTLSSQKAWIEHEVGACKIELQIVNLVSDQKKQLQTECSARNPL